ncbi:MAG: ribonuclease PH [Candidatus Binatia bacterium]
MRADGRTASQLRSVNITTDFIRRTAGSVLIEVGETRVICTATVEEDVPRFLRGTTQGWVTGEYGMLPGSGATRIPREAARGRVGGRTHEIQRLIGRSLRAVTNLALLGSRTIWLDCDVIQADGGTRTAAVTGAYVALALAVHQLRGAGEIAADPLTGSVAAVSAGMVRGEALLDLCYDEDSHAEVDMNFVMTAEGGFVEVQGTAESKPFGKAELDRLADLAWIGIRQLIELQQRALAPHL